MFILYIIITETARNDLSGEVFPCLVPLTTEGRGYSPVFTHPDFVSELAYIFFTLILFSFSNVVVLSRRYMYH